MNCKVLFLLYLPNNGEISLGEWFPKCALGIQRDP